jgi:benzylsuccinate CoA-transferase BbsF subunit
MCTALSELGAEVIKVESAVHPDVLRHGGPSVNLAFTFNTESRGRKSVVLDLTTAEGREIAMQLCASADVVAENYRGGVLESFGLGYEAVRARNPDVIYLSSQGYGQGGPYGRMPAFGPLNVGFAGLHLMWNQPDAPYPCGTTLPHPDHIVGKLLATCILSALHHRSRTGEGQRLEMAQTESAAYLNGEIYLRAALEDRDPDRIGNRNPNAAPHGVYPSAGDDRWVAIAVMDDDGWQRLCKAIGRDLDPALATLEGRLAAQDELDAELMLWTRARSAEEAAELLQAHGVSAVPVMGPLDQFADPHLSERVFVDDLFHAELGEEQQIRNPIRMSRLRQRTAKSAPCLGVDTEEVLRDILGLSGAEVAELRSSGVCR